MLPARPPRKRFRWLDLFVWLLCLGTLAGIGWAFYLAHSGVSLRLVGNLLRGDTTPPFADQESVNLLIIGVDDKIERGRADTLIVASINFKTKRLGLLSLPRDTRVSVPGRGFNKINACYSLGGAELCKETVSAILDIPVDYFLKTDFKGIQKIVDAMGGVVIDVEKDMSYDDRNGNLHIHLKKGRQRLNGYDAMCYVRFRHDIESDYGRMRRQKQFLLAAYRQMLTGEAGKNPDVLLLARQITRYVKTNLSDRQVAWLARFGKQMDPASALVAAVPSEAKRIGRVDYEIVDESVARGLAAEMQRRLSVDPQYDYKFARVEVQSAGAPTQLASLAAHTVRAAGYRVVEVGLRRDRFPLTKIFFSAGYRSAAVEIADALGTQHYYPRPATPRSDAPEITVVLGADASTLLRPGSTAENTSEALSASGSRRS